MIEEAINARLSSWPALAALIADRLYPMEAPQNAPAPYVIYQRITGSRLRSIQGVSGQANPQFQIDAYGITYAQAKAVAAQVRLALDGFRGVINLPDGTAEIIRSCSLEMDRDLKDTTAEPALFRVLHEFSFWHDE